jgi:hypothetical protein
MFVGLGVGMYYLIEMKFIFMANNQNIMSEAKLTIEIKNTKPIELTAIVDMFTGLASEYNKFVIETDGFELTEQTRLYVKEVRSGSQIYELVDLVPLALPFIENTNSVFEFAKHLKSTFDFFVGKTEEKPKLDSTDIKNISKIVEPVVKDNASQIHFNATHQENHIHYHYNSVETNAIQNKMNIELAALKEPDHSIKENEVFYWFVAKDSLKSQSGDRGIIEAISSRDLKVIFDKPELKDKMLNISENPFHLAWVVDVKVGTIEGRPAFYKIMDVKESFPKSS